METSGLPAVSSGVPQGITTTRPPRPQSPIPNRQPPLVHQRGRGAMPMDIAHDTRDGQPVVLLRVPGCGPPVTLDTAGWAALDAAGVTSVVAQRGASGEAIVARTGKCQVAAARLIWGADPPARIRFANGDHRDLRRANLVSGRGIGGSGPHLRSASDAPFIRRRAGLPLTEGARPNHAEGLGGDEATAWAGKSDEERRATIRALVLAGYRRMWHAHRGSSHPARPVSPGAPTGGPEATLWASVTPSGWTPRTRCSAQCRPLPSPRPWASAGPP